MTNRYIRTLSAPYKDTVSPSGATEFLFHSHFSCSLIFILSSWKLSVKVFLFCFVLTWSSSLLASIGVQFELSFCFLGFFGFVSLLDACSESTYLYLFVRGISLWEIYFTVLCFFDSCSFTSNFITNLKRYKTICEQLFTIFIRTK